MSDLPSPKTTGKRIAINAVSNLVGVGTDMVISFVLLRFILRIMTKDAYGIWEITGGIFAYTAMLQLGLNSAVNYFIPPLLVKKDYAGLNRVVSTAIVFFGIGSLAILTATAVLTVYFPVWFHIEPVYAGASRTVVAMVGGFLALSVPLTVFSGVLSGLQQYVALNAARLIFRVLRAVLIVIVLSSGFGLVGLAVAHVTTRLAEVLSLPILAKRGLPELRVRLSLASMETFRRMIGYSIHTTLWSLSGMIRDRAAFIVIGVVMTPAAAALFAIPALLMRALYALTQSFASVTKPAASALMAEDRPELIEALVLRGARYVATLVIPSVAFAVLFGDAIINLWVGEDFREMAKVWTVLIVPQTLVLIQSVVAFVMIGLGRHRAFGLFAMTMALVSVVLMIVLTNVFDMGLRGIAMGVSLPTIVTGVAFIPLYTCHTLKIGLGVYWWNMFLRPLVASLPFLAILGITRTVWNPQTVLSLAVAAAVSFPILFVCDYFFVANPPERERIRALAARLRTRRAQ